MHECNTPCACPGIVMQGGGVGEADNPGGQAILAYQGLQNAKGIAGPGHYGRGCL